MTELRHPTGRSFPYGGLVSVPATRDLAGIPANRRDYGMLVFVYETNSYVKLDRDLRTWEPFQPDNRFIFAQLTPVLSWNIVHTLGGFPSVTTTNAAGKEIKGEVVYVSDTTIAVSFSRPLTGFAYLN